MKTSFELWLEIKAWDADGKVSHQEQRRLSRSPVQQLIEILLSQLGQQNVSINDTGGIHRTFASSAMDGDAAANDETHGIVIGISGTAVDIADGALGTLIADGVGSGEMLYGACEFDATVTVLDPNATFNTWRNFNNNSGATITVRETGLYIKGGIYYYCIVRDVPTAIAVVDGGGCYVKYTLKASE